MKKKILRKLSALGLVFSLTASCLLPAASPVRSQAATGRVSVHDPSIIKANGTYYIFGSHLADAKSSDLVKWTQMNTDYGTRNWKNDSVYGNVIENLSESFRWAGYDDGDCSGGNLAVWAPDVKWNPDYEWADGSTGAYMLYYSASSTWRRSCIGYAVSKDVEGPYSYVDTIVYSGFTTSGATDGTSTRNTRWDNDYLNLKKLIQNGTIKDVSSNWFNADGSYNTNYAPNAIDPTIVFDKNGDMHMVYGSWSGGLYILPLDKRTGAAIYPGTDATDSVSGNYTDRYFGTHIAGGNHQSGEGPYILYDKETDYYYMYETYGGLLGSGGYNMRLFRAKNLTGPYLDAKGNNAVKNKANNSQYGIKLIGNYQFTGQTGYRAAGHNSALIDDDGSRYLIYHQRFTGNEYYHEVRVHQQFMNEDNWPVTAVYENKGDKIGHYTDEEVIGTYEVINHGTSTDGTMLKTQTITLCADGTITGSFSGTWKRTSAGDYDYITLSDGSATYKGVTFRQTGEKSAQVMTFTALSDKNTALWGTQTSSAASAQTPSPSPAATSAPTATVTPAPAATPSPTPAATAAPTKEPEISSDDTKETDSLKKTTLKVKAGKKKASLSWKKIKGSNGYQICFSKKASMKSAQTKKINKAATVKTTIKNLKKNKTYYFRIRAFCNEDGVTIYGPWSKKVKTKIK